MLTVSCVDTQDGFESLRDRWDALSANSGSVFQTWEWCWAWWRRYGRGRRLFIICVEEGERLVGLAPLFISSYLGLPFRVASLIGTGPSDYGDILIEPGRTEAAIGAMLDYLEANRRWDVLDLQQLPPASTALRIESLTGIFSTRRLGQDECFSMDLPSSYDEYLASLSKKFRWNVEYYRRRLSRDHDVNFRKTVDEQSVSTDIDTFFRLHQKRFISKRKLGRFISPAFVRFHAESALELLKVGRLGLFFLEIDGKPVAALYGFELHGCFYYYLAGFEPEWGRMSVSTVLLSYVIEECIDQGMRSFDFLRGNEGYKLKWGAEGSQNTRLVVERPTQRASIVRRLLQAENELLIKAKARAAEI